MVPSRVDTAPVAGGDAGAVKIRPVSGVAIAVKPMGAAPVTDAVSDWVVAPFPSFHVADAVPSAAVVSTVNETVPLSADGVHVTFTPDRLFPTASCTLTTSGAGSARLALVV